MRETDRLSRRTYVKDSKALSATRLYCLTAMPHLYVYLQCQRQQNIAVSTLSVNCSITMRIVRFDTPHGSSSLNGGKWASHLLQA